MRYAEAVVSTLNETVPPRLTLMSVAKPWRLASPEPLTSHSLAGLPGLQFSASMALTGLPQLARAVPSWKDQATTAATMTNRAGAWPLLDPICIFYSNPRPRGCGVSEDRPTGHTTSDRGTRRGIGERGRS